MRALATLTASAVLLYALPAAAQYTAFTGTGASYGMPQQALLDTMITGAAQSAAWRDYAKGRKDEKTETPGVAAGGASTARATHPLKATDFRPVRDRLLLDEMSRVDGATPGQQQALRRYYAQALDAIEKQGRKNNLAFAIAFLYGASLQIADDVTIPDAEFRELQQRMNEALLAQPRFGRLTNRQKQKIYESALITGIGLAAFNAAAKEQRNAALVRQTREAARRVLAGFGVADAPTPPAGGAPAASGRRGS